jgi:hypothetical protein
MRLPLILTALASLTACASAPPPQPIPGTLALIVTHPDGSEWVIDYNLSPDDCDTYAMRAARANPHSTITCAVQPE